MIAKLALVAALAGSGIGAAVVLADEPGPAPAAKVPAVATPHPTGDSQPPIAASHVEVALRREDPKGGAPWAIRRFKGAFPKHTTADCIEVGRVVDGAFGWIDGTGAFKPTTPGRSASPSNCFSAKSLEAFGANGQRFGMLSIAPGKSPQPLETVTWGAVPPTVRTILPQGAAAITPEKGLFLQIEPGQMPQGIFTGTVDHTDGRRTRFNRVDLPFAKREQPVPGTETVAVQAPDPAGGTPWGIIASRGSAGSICLAGPDLLVGTRLGPVDTALGVMHPGPYAAMGGCGGPREPSRGYPLRTSSSSWSGQEEDPVGSVERRVLSNRIILWGRAYKDVATVTIHTPRDVRTLVPSGAAHVFMAVYDGGFPTGKVTATARFKDGKEVTRSVTTG